MMTISEIYLKKQINKQTILKSEEKVYGEKYE